MFKIILCCASGMSSSLLVEKMKRAATDQNIDVNVLSVGEDEIHEEAKNADVIILGPQVRFAKKRIEEAACGVPVIHVGVRDYGMLDGKAVLKQALETIGKKL